MSDTTYPALIKILEDGRTVTLTIEPGQCGSDPLVVARIDGDKVGDCVGPHVRPRADAPADIVARVGPIGLTQVEADQVRNDYRVYVATLPSALRAQRNALARSLARALTMAHDELVAATDAWEGGVDPWPSCKAVQARIAARRALLDAFDTAHPEIRAEVVAERDAATERAMWA